MFGCGEMGDARTRRTVGLFAVPEDREVLQTPQENQNSGFVFGDAARETRSEAPTLTAFGNLNAGGNADPFYVTRFETVAPATEIGSRGLVNGFLQPACNSMNTNVESQGVTEASVAGGSFFSPTRNVSTEDGGQTVTMASVTNASGPQTNQMSTSLLLAPPSLNASAPATAPLATSGVMTMSQPIAFDPDLLALQPCYDEEGNFRDPRDPIHQGTWNPCHGFVIPDPRQFAEIQSQVEAMRAERERIASEPLPKAMRTESKHPSFEDRMEALKKQMDYEEVVYEKPPKSWQEQYREAKAKEKQEQEEFANALKRMRDEEDEAWITEEEKARKKAAFKNTMRLLKEAEERRAAGIRSVDGLTESEMEDLLPKRFSNRQYYIRPSFEDLKNIIIGRGANAMKEVANVRFGHRNFGEISFDRPVNLEKLDFEKELAINHGHVKRKEMKQLANIPVTVTLYKVVLDALFDAHEITEKKLRELCEQPGSEFVSYDEDGTWKFKLDNLADL